MMAHTHILFALFLVIVPGSLLGMPLAPLVLAPAVFGALLPDIDHPKSMVGRVTRPFSTLLGKTVGHRTLTHSLMGLVIFALLTVGLKGYFALPPSPFVGAVLGYASHILADMLNSSGVCLLFPFHEDRMSLLGRFGIGTGTATEAVFTLVLVGAVSFSIWIGGIA